MGGINQVTPILYNQGSVNSRSNAYQSVIHALDKKLATIFKDISKGRGLNKPYVPASGLSQITIRVKDNLAHLLENVTQSKVEFSDLDVKGLCALINKLNGTKNKPFFKSATLSEIARLGLELSKVYDKHVTCKSEIS